MGKATRTWLAAVAISVGATAVVCRAEAPEPRHSEASPAAAEHGTAAVERPAVEAEPHPVVSGNGAWAGWMVIITGALFFVAWFIGTFGEFDAAVEVPPAHAHDEPPGSSHHHGTSGTSAEAPHH